jgi:hypothetical protein
VKFHISAVVRTLCVALLCVVVLLPGTALAHEHRTIANGKYDLTVGWDSEPTYAGLKNSAGIRIMAAGTQNPIEGADKALKVQIRQGASTRDLPLHAVFGQAGYYTADFIPTRVGDYIWMFTGNINGDPVNETFDTADGKIDSVQPQAALQFPAAQADPAIQAAQADAQSARTLAYVGIGIGILGVLAGALAWLTRTRAPLTTATNRPAGERI